MHGFFAEDRQMTYDCASRSLLSPSGRALLQGVDLDAAAREFPGVALRVANTHALA